MTKSSLGKCYISNGGQRPRPYPRRRYLLPRGNRTWWLLPKVRPHSDGLHPTNRRCKDPSTHRNQDSFTVIWKDSRLPQATTSLAPRKGLASTAAVSNEMLRASPPVNAKKPERARDHRRMAAPANPRDGQADIRVTSPVAKTFPPKKNDPRHAASQSGPVLKGFWDWSR